MIGKDESTGLYTAEIDGQTYEFAKWGAEESIDTLLDLCALMGKPFGTIAAKVASDGAQALEAEGKGSPFDVAMDHIVESMATRKTTVMKMIKRLSTREVMCDGAKITAFDLHYRDKLPHLFRVVRAALEVQYGDFFADLAAPLGLKPQARAGSPGA